ncbi:MAG: sigma-54-dependent Fis family transcriptional regulator [Planctomycetes bacterium]|nr:sigma-54-dependent Fis family transcriptional regulator [Planctomycetota bacterium]
MAKRILILDTPAGDLRDLAAAFERVADGSCEVRRVTAAEALRVALRSGLPWDLVLIDIDLGDGEAPGLDLLPDLRREFAELSIVAVSEQGDVERAGKAIGAGANDFLVRSGQLADRVATLLRKVRPQLTLLERNRLLREQNALLREADRRRHRIVGESPQVLAVLERVRRVARIPRPVLIVGERGTGKELVARAIHEEGGGAGRPLIVVNCAAFPDTLLESELFGHEKGAFTGAEALVHGKFELAAGGTLFLDEIGHMSLPFQQKILRVVEYGTFTRVGGIEEIRVHARIIAATNVDLRRRMEEGTFLRDLYDRLSFEVIEVPPLREREGDIEILSRHFLEEFMREIPALRGKRIAREALDILRAYSFPGNVRELKTIIERAAYRDTTNELNPEDLGVLGDPRPVEEGGTFREKIDAFERRLIREALERSGGNRARAARDLGLEYHQFRYYVKKGDPKKGGR